jgi:hypothetical protein
MPKPKHLPYLPLKPIIFSGKLDMRPNSWGLTEAELFLSKGAPTESSLGDRAADGDTDSIVRRRLLIGLGITVAAVALSFVSSCILSIAFLALLSRNLSDGH